MAPRLLVCVLVVCVGCTSTPKLTRTDYRPEPDFLADAEATQTFVESSVSNLATDPSFSSRSIPVFDYDAPGLIEPAEANHDVLTVSAELPPDLIDLSQEDTVVQPSLPTVLPQTAMDSTPSEAIQLDESFELNLPSALAMVGGQHPAVAIARWRVREAYETLARAKVVWLPSIQAGFGFHRHDGNYQASDGTVVDVNRNSFQYGLGTGATGAGTTPQPGLVARFHLADAIFQPKIAQKTAWARGHASAATLNQQLLRAALAYLELLAAHQEVEILSESADRLRQLAKITQDFAQAGEGLQADADRMHTEEILTEDRQLAARERVAVASAALAEAISLDACCQIKPLDVTVVPLELCTAQGRDDRCGLIAVGLQTRPELKESQALVAVACEAYRREKYAPFVPSTLLGFSSGGFGGGLGNNLANVDSRYDFDALMTWQVRNFGLGERAARRESAARVQQAKFAKIQTMDRVAREVSESASQLEFRRARVVTTERAIQSAADSYERSVSRIRDGQGLPIEVLQSVQALEAAKRAYLNAVIEHNQAQFRLQWALGWPVDQI